jgi:hypothetical protein
MSESNGFALDLPEDKEDLRIRVRGQPYLIREMDDWALDQWMNYELKSTRYDSEGKFLGKDLTGRTVFLISLCLFTEDGQSRVPRALIATWKGPTLLKVFDYCEKHNDLQKQKPEDKLGKGSGGGGETTGTSESPPASAGASETSSASAS